MIFCCCFYFFCFFFSFFFLFFSFAIHLTFYRHQTATIVFFFLSCLGFLPFLPFERCCCCYCCNILLQRRKTHQSRRIYWCHSISIVAISWLRYCLYEYINLSMYCLWATVVSHTNSSWKPVWLSRHTNTMISFCTICPL